METTNAIRAELHAQAKAAGYHSGPIDPGCAIYSPSWTTAYVETSSRDSREAQRALRAERRADAKRTGRAMRIRVECWRKRDLPGVSIAGDPIGGEAEDWAEVYGWRAALAAARTMRAWYTREDWRYYNMLLLVSDPRLDDAIGEELASRFAR